MLQLQKDFLISNKSEAYVEIQWIHASFWILLNGDSDVTKRLIDSQENSQGDIANVI